MRGVKRLRRSLVLIAVTFLVGACGNNRQGQWPATISGFQNFSADQQNAVMAALTKLNVNENVILTSTPDSGTNTNASTNAGYPIFFVLTPPTSGTENRAGLATVGPDQCTIQLSTDVFTPERKGYIEPVVWHEVGHCAGLQHVPQNGEIMYFSTEPIDEYSQDALTRFFASIRSSAGL